MKATLYNALETFGQQHLLDFWDELNGQQQGSLAAEIGGIDFDEIASLYEEYKRNRRAEEVRAPAERAGAAPSFRLGDPENRFSPEEARRRGAEALRAGRVGVGLPAGGQGTRLGFKHPKGMYPIGPVSKNSLFQILVEKILAASRRYGGGAPIPLYLMTSPKTDAETRDFLARHDRFGLPEDDLTIICQGTMPAVDAATGKVLLADRDRVALSPDGHGGMLAALARHGCLDDLRRRGVEHLFYLQVDNPLVEICSPEFLGYHLLSGSEMSTEVVAKRTPLDRVGNVVEVEGRLQVVEYSDLPKRVAERRNADGSLLLSAGSIAVHAINVAFLERMAARADALPFHFARKKVQCIKPGSARPLAEKVEVVQFERFIFDLIPAAQNAIVVEVDRERHFAPLKSGARRGWVSRLLKSTGLSREDEDTPETVRAQMVALHTGWLRRAGAEVAEGVAVEISPLFALDEADLAEKIPPQTRVSEPAYFS